MFKLRKFTILGKISANFEFDGNNMPQKIWDRAMCTTV